MTEDIAAILAASPVIPVLTIERVANAVPLAQALVDGGLTILEITLRTDAALEAITAVAKGVPDAIAGAGTVLSPSDLKAAKDAGAKFAVSPGLSDTLAASAQDFPFLPGIATASEIMRGREFGLRHFKFFPAESAGGPAALKSFAGPFPDVHFCPTGGITGQSASAYLALKNVTCVGGSWMVPHGFVEAGRWRDIADLARAARRLRP